MTPEILGILLSGNISISAPIIEENRRSNVEQETVCVAPPVSGIGNSGNKFESVFNDNVIRPAPCVDAKFEIWLNNQSPMLIQGLNKELVASLLEEREACMPSDHRLSLSIGDIAPSIKPLKCNVWLFLEKRL